MYLADAIEAMGAKKVFIMLGMNDIAVYGNERCREKHGNRIGANKRKESGHNHLCAINDANRRYCTKPAL